MDFKNNKNLYSDESSCRYIINGENLKQIKYKQLMRIDKIQHNSKLIYICYLLSPHLRKI